MTEKTFYDEGKEYYEKMKTLKMVKNENWETFYLDEVTGDKWIREYPNGEQQGGGSATLTKIERFP